MPIKIPNALPAREILAKEGVMVMSEETALRQDIRPLQIALLNLMPNKSETETQFARLIGATPLQIELTLARMSEHRSKTTSARHLEAFYKPFSALRDAKFDGLVVTGAPVERLPFEEVDYWDELREVFAWAQRSVYSTLAICWGAQAWLQVMHGVPKHALDRKAFGCFRHQVTAPGSPFLRGFSDDFIIPVSRWTEVRATDLPPELELLLTSDETGPCLVRDTKRRTLCMFNHIEYDTGSLAAEFRRDRAKDPATRPPENYFPNDDASAPPDNRWRAHAHLLFGNWINEVYQGTPYDLDALPLESGAAPLVEQV